jgi:Pyruvate/2-oxoacid:ferredoxin oxidoreductase delta subunit
MQAVLPHHTMEKVIEDADVIAVAHCPCRVSYKLVGKGCDHPTEVCMKFNDMARYVIDRGLAREITKDEAHEIVKRSEEAGLVHFVDNAEGDILHNCNCCGCACWNVGNIRRRKIPRDVLMATYFLRETDDDACIGCGECETLCPVQAVKMEDEIPVVDTAWCIGCGVCATVCPTDAVAMKLRSDRTGKLPASNCHELHNTILKEKRLG